MSSSTRSPIASAAARARGRAWPLAPACGFLLACGPYLAPAPSLASQPAVVASGAPVSYGALGAQLPFASESRLRWWGLHVYDARLTTTARFDPVRPFATRFMLELTYARELSGAKIAAASADEIARLGLGTAAQRARWHAAMTRVFPDVSPGRRIAGANLPGEGAVFFVDGRFAGRIDDPEFARAFFAIWFDERTAEPALRAELLRTRETTPTAAARRAEQ